MAKVECRQQIGDQCAVGGLVEGHAECSVVVLAQVDLAFAGRISDLSRRVQPSFTEPNANRVKDRAVTQGQMPKSCQPLYQGTRVRLSSPRDSA